MTRVVMIDDDYIVRQYIRMVLEETEGEFELVGEAGSGEKGLQILAEVQPDILILDMEMPSMSGGDILKRLEEMQMKLQVLILSCHDGYDYVRQAMKLGAADYLLKHKEDDKGLLTALRNLRDEATKTVETPHKRDDTEDKKNALGDLLTGSLGEEDLTRAAGLLAEPGQTVIVCTAVIDYLRKYLRENGKEAAYRLEKKVWKIMQSVELCECQAYVHRMDMGNYSIVLVFDDLSVLRMEARWQIRRILTKYMSEIQSECEVSLSFGVSDRMKGAREIHRQWENGYRAMEQRFYQGCGHIIFCGEMVVCRKEEPSQQYILDKLLSGESSKEECLVVIEELFDNIQMFPLFPDCFMRLFYKLTDILLQMISRMHLQITQVFHQVNFISELLLTHETLEDYRKWCLDTVCVIFEEAEKASRKKWRREVEQAIRYVDQHYMEKISLEDVAKHVGVSKTYFSGLFKKEVGQKFSLYVLDFRLERACELLRSGKEEIYNIAYDTGFQSQNYFTNIFKKKYGMTPKEYRREFNAEDRN